MVENTCPECGSEDLINDFERAELVCGRCGLVIDEFMPYGSYNHNECDNLQKYNKVIEDSTTFTLHDKGLGTNIDNQNKDSQGEKIPSRNRGQLYKLRRWEMKTRVSGTYEKNLSKALEEIDKYGSIIGISKNMKEDSSILYRNALDCGLVTGRSIHKIVSACLFITCRRFNAPRTLDEISEIMDISKKSLAKSYKSLCRELNIKLPLASPINFVPRVASELGLSDEIQAKSIEIIEKAKRDLTPGNPKIIAAAALYAASNSLGEDIRLKDIKEVAGVSGATLNKRSKELSQFLD